MSGPTRVILVRHGQTTWNDAGRFQGHLDSPLTDIGIVQAKALGWRLRASRIAAVYSSDLGRAAQTARCIVADAPAPQEVLFDERLRERCLGVFQGLDRNEIRARYPTEAEAYYSRDPHFVVPEGESAHQHFEKGFAALNEIARRHVGKTIVVVTHGGLVSSMFRHVTGIDFGARRTYSLQNAAYNCFLFQESRWTLETWGDISHFPIALRSRSEGFAEAAPRG